MRVIVQFPDGTFMRRNGKPTKNLQEARTWRSRSNYQLDRVPKGSKFIEVELTVKESRLGSAAKVEWECPINSPGCVTNCGSYGCGN